MVYHFIKFGWIVLLNDKTAKINLMHSENVLQPLILWQSCLLIMEYNSNNKISQFWLEINIQYIFWNFLLSSKPSCCRIVYTTIQKHLCFHWELQLFGGETPVKRWSRVQFRSRATFENFSIGCWISDTDQMNSRSRLELERLPALSEATRIRYIGHRLMIPYTGEGMGLGEGR